MTEDTLTIRDKVKKYVVNAASADNEKINDNSLIFKEGYFDSMGFMVLIAFLEEEFGIKTLDADLLEENFESINAISEFVKRKSN